MGEPQNETKEAEVITFYGMTKAVKNLLRMYYKEQFIYPRYVRFMSQRQYEYELRKDTDEVLFSNGGMAFGL